MKIIRNCVFGLFGCMGWSLASADGILMVPNVWQPVLGGGGGMAISSNPGRSQYFPVITPGVSQYYDYDYSSSTQTKGLFEVFLGAERALYSDWRIQPGIAYSQASTYQVSGFLTQGLDSQSADQFTYNYKVATRQLLAQAKLMHTLREIYYPYFLLGLGASFNTASNYSNNIPPLLISSRDYANNTSSSFSYRVGAGVDMDLFKHTRLGVAYRFSGLGAVNLGGANISGVSVPGTLTQSQMYANEVLFQLTYIV